MTALLILCIPKTLPVQYATVAVNRPQIVSTKHITPVFDESHRLNPQLNRLAAEPVKATQTTFWNWFKEQRGTEENGPAWNEEVVPTVSLNTPQLVSIYYQGISYEGGTHPTRFSNAVTVGLIKGKVTPITYDHIFRSSSSKLHVLNNIVAPNLRHQFEARTGRSGNWLATPPNESETTTVLSENGITFIYDPYVIGAFSDGSFQVKLTWQELQGHINTDLIPFALP